MKTILSLFLPWVTCLSLLASFSPTLAHAENFLARCQRTLLLTAGAGTSLQLPTNKIEWTAGAVGTRKLRPEDQNRVKKPNTLYQVYNVHVNNHLDYGYFSFEVWLPFRMDHEKIQNRLTAIFEKTPPGLLCYTRELIWSASAETRSPNHVTAETDNDSQSNIILYPLGWRSDAYLAKIFWQTLGYAISDKLLANNHFYFAQWRNYMNADKSFPTSRARFMYKSYNNAVEDFAATVALYVASDAGLNSFNLRNRLKNRFSELDGVFRIKEDEVNAIQNARTLKTLITTGAAAAAAAAAILH